MLAKYPIDPQRVGITGWSYGGFMTMFAVTQTNRFKAAVAGAGISNWQSYYGENSIDQWMIPYFGASVYDDPAVYAKSSAINFIKQAQTPTLVVVGDRDGECPAPQSYEFWHALRDEHVPTQLVVYPNEGHGFVNPDHRRDVMDRAVEWFARYMPPAPIIFQHHRRFPLGAIAPHLGDRESIGIQGNQTGQDAAGWPSCPDTLFFGANRACSVDRLHAVDECRRPVARAL